MGKSTFRGVFTLVSLAILALASVVAAQDVTATVDSVAGRLVQGQVKDGATAGLWEEGFNGSIAAGMISAYQYTKNVTYRDSAVLGGQYILKQRNGDDLNLFGDEAYAFTLLSEISDKPTSNQWRSAISGLYSAMDALPGGVLTYIEQYYQVEPSTGVFYMAHHVLATSYVKANCKSAWTDALVYRLQDLKNWDAAYPVMGLGVAVWALAQAGAIDNSPLPVWGGKISDLPTILLSHQVPAGKPNAGSFYWRFDHGDGGTGLPVSGYTEDTTWAVLGLMAAAKANPSLKTKVDAAVAAARDALIGAAGPDGKVYESLIAGMYSDPAFAGELLQLLPKLDTPAPASAEASK